MPSSLFLVNMSSSFYTSFALYPSPCRSLPVRPSLNIFFTQKRKQPISCIQASPEVQSQNAKPDQIVRRTANFHPSIWGDQFLNCDYSDITHFHKQKRVDELKVVVRSEVFTNIDALGDDFSHQLKLIDAIQRLGVAYHFEREIEEALEHIYATTQRNNNDGDLYNVALGFRLLRQHGYNVSCEIFNKFKDENGGFKESIIDDVSGMLSLYEATHLRVHGEDILEEALVFTTTHLESVKTRVGNPSAAQITEALERPLRKSLERLYARSYMSIYQDEASHNKALLRLAKLDFNLVQYLHKKELSEITRWYKEVDFERKLPYARERIVELFFWIMGIYFEPQYMLGRKILTRMIQLVTVMDDTYDAYGTFEELEILTKAIERWDISCIDELPDYMKPFYQILLDVVNEVEEEMVKQGRSYRVYYAKEIIKIQARFYLDEAKWIREGIPSMEEYMRVGAGCIGNSMLSVVSLVGMGDLVTKETFEWLFNNPKILRASNVIFRFMDDIAGSKLEKERGHVGSSIDCYMKQYGVSEQEALDVLNKQAVDLWKDINEEFFRPTDVPMPVLTRVLNLTKVVDLLYKRGDGFTYVGQLMKDTITSLFIDPVPL